jgi:hypothetical protein
MEGSQELFAQTGLKPQSSPASQVARIIGNTNACLMPVKRVKYRRHMI